MKKIIALVVLALGGLWAQANDYQAQIDGFQKTCFGSKTTSKILVSEQYTPFGLHVQCEFDAMPAELDFNDSAFETLQQRCMDLGGEYRVLRTLSMPGNQNLPSYLKVSCYFAYWD